MTKPGSILLIDDDGDTLEQLQTSLQRAGYQVLVAADGQAALRLAIMARPALIVSDLLLAGIDGYEVWQAIRTDNDLRNVPILVISALAIPGTNEPWRPTPHSEWQLLSYDAFLPKPIDLRRFMRMVEKLIAPDQVRQIPTGPSVVVAIEDQELQQRAVDILSQHDFGVESPASLPAATSLVRTVPPAALLLDYRNFDESVRALARQIRRFVPTTAVILIINPDKEIDPDIEGYYDGLLSTPLQATLMVTAINRILNLATLERRIKILSTQLMLTNRNLLLTQQTLRAQNEELAYTNTKLHEVDSLKEALTGMVVHDLKSPLGAVLGALNFLLSSPQISLPGNFENLMIGAVAAGHQLLRLVETLLEGQRLEEGRLKPDAEPIDLAGLIEGCVQQILPLLTLHRLQVETEIEDNLPLVFADLHISQRVLENLLDNAVKFSPPTKTITIKTSAYANFVQVNIMDHGPGIPIEQQTEVFQRFAQVKSTLSKSRAGFGIGLAFCKMAINAMGGSIWVESDGESGSTFIFTLPIYEE